MIGLDDLEKIVRYTLASGYVKGDKPLSILLIADVESGKTTIIKKYCLKADNVFYTTDATAYGIIRDTTSLKDFEEGKITHIVIPDLISCLARRESTVKTFIAFMNALIEDGYVNISTYAIPKGQIVSKKSESIRAGLITSITKKMFYDKRHNWEKYGFLSRVLPVSYAYSGSTQLEILDFIEKEQHLSAELEKFKIPDGLKVKEIELPYELSKKLEPYSIKFAQVQKLYGFRMQRQLQTLLKSIARARGKDKVDEDGFEEFRRISKFIGLDFVQV